MTPVQIETGTSRWWRLGVALIAATSVGSVAGWWWLMPAESAALAAATASAAIAIGLALFASLWRAGTSRLVFDGSSWTLIRSGLREPLGGTVSVMVDLGEFLLLRFEGDAAAGRIWLPVDSSSPVSPWHALRAALYAAPRAPAPFP